MVLQFCPWSLFVVKVTLCSVENCSFFETEHANTSKNILVSHGGVVIKSCYKTGQLSIKNCPFNFVNTVENFSHSTKIELNYFAFAS